MALWQWSPTAANNASAGTINWAEGQAPSTVNDSARQMMADIASWWASAEWLNLGLTPTYVSATQFTVSGNQTAVYTPGRRVRAFVTAGTVYGLVTSSSFNSSNTTVTVSLDAGNLDSGLSEVDVGFQNPATPTAPALSYFDAGGNGGQARYVSGNYGVILRNDSSSFFLLQTASGSPYGSYNAYRPFSWSLNTGAVNIDGTGIGTTFGGNVLVNGTVTQTSDKRAKTDIQVINDALKKVNFLNGVTYRRKDVDQGVRHAGLIAQEVQRVLPEAVKVGPDGMLSVAYGNVIGLLVEAIKELSAEVEALKSK